MLIYGGVFDVDKRTQEMARLEEAMGESGFWNNQAKAQAISREISDHKKIIDQWNKLESQAEDLETLFELAVEEGDKDAYNEIEEGLDSQRSLLELSLIHI